MSNAPSPSRAKGTFYRAEGADQVRLATGSPSHMTAAAPQSRHKWSFYRVGGVDQVKLADGRDILSLDQRDQKLWVALSCPVKGLEFDARTRELLDTDKDGHVRPPELLAAVKWLQQVVGSGDDIAKGTDGFQLANLRTDTA